ncbi:MAG: protease modulator HflK, partial [Lachnospiraceae bacterium]|nr:protease modulator HflK [Lachnospiraceae bacterium]
SYNVDSVLTTGKNEIQANIKEMLMDKLEQYKIGITLRDISIQDAEPPTMDVTYAFKAVETAKQGKDTAINNANKYANEVLPAAQANADMIIQAAEAEKAAKINEANGQTARFNSLYEEYKNYPLITKQRMFYETMEGLLPNMKVIIQSDGGATETILPLESFVTTEPTETTPSASTTGQ